MLIGYERDLLAVGRPGYVVLDGFVPCQAYGVVSATVHHFHHIQIHMAVSVGDERDTVGGRRPSRSEVRAFGESKLVHAVRVAEVYAAFVASVYLSLRANTTSWPSLDQLPTSSPGIVGYLGRCQGAVSAFATMTLVVSHPAR